MSKNKQILDTALTWIDRGGTAMDFAIRSDEIFQAIKSIEELDGDSPDLESAIAQAEAYHE